MKASNLVVICLLAGVTFGCTTKSEEQQIVPACSQGFIDDYQQTKNETLVAQAVCDIYGAQKCHGAAKASFKTCDSFKAAHPLNVTCQAISNKTGKPVALSSNAAYKYCDDLAITVIAKSSQSP